MSYPPPPGASNSSSSLPPRPPPQKGFKPAFSSAPQANSVYSPASYSSAPSYTAAHQYGASYQSYPQTGGMNAGGYSGYHQHGGYQQQQQNYYGGAGQVDSSTSYSAAPQIRNPFPVPGQAQPSGGDYDTDMAAQIAQWQSAYMKDPKEAASAPTVRTTTTYSGDPTKNAAAAAAAAPVVAGPNPEKKKTVVRAGGGQKWTDDTLLEWDPSHLRLFVGNLAGETTDESLYKAFSQWKSLQKARVIRDKVTSKSRGYGFVSFSDPDEFFAAAKEMNGKYIQSHPVIVKRSTTEIKAQNAKDKHHGGKWNKKNKNRSGNGSGIKGRENSYEPTIGPTGGGVTKPGQKTKGGLKLLG